MTVKIISTSNRHVVEARKLTQKKHRRQQNRFAAAGLQILGMAIEEMSSSRMEGRIRPIDVFFCDQLFTTDTAPRILTQLIAAGANDIAVSQHVLETLSDRELSQGLVATFEIDSMLYSLSELNPGTSQQPYLFIMLDRPQYPGNLGTLIRTADAVGAHGIIIIEPAVDTFAPKSIRAAMGSIFAVPIVRLDDILTLGNWGTDSVIRWIGTDASDGDLVWDSDAIRGSVGLILGNEGEGLQPGLRQLVDQTVRLPQRGSAESLNVSIAGGILMYEWMRVNRSALGGCC